MARFRPFVLICYNGGSESEVPMTIYYVDYENVHAGVDGVDKLTPEDTVRVFYSPKADTMRIAFVEQALNASCKIELISVDNGTPNALDFQLVAWLFSELPKGEAEHVIVSNDRGYDAAIRMGVRLGFPEVRRVSCIAEALGVPVTQLDEPAGKRRGGSRRGGSRRRGAAAVEVVEAAEVAEAAEVVEAVEAAPEAPVEEPEAVEEAVVAEAAAEEVPAQKPVSELEAAVEEVAEEAPKPRRNRRRCRSVKVEAAAPVEELASVEEPAPAAPEPELAPAPELEPASEPDPAAEEAPKPKRNRRRRKAAKPDDTAAVRELLSARGITLLDDQLSVVVKSAQATTNKQEFYRTIIQKLGQKQGLSVYGQVKALFKEIAEALQA